MKTKGRLHGTLKRYCQRCRQSRIVHWNNAGTARYCSTCLKKVEKREPTEAQQASLKRRKHNRKNKIAIAQAWIETYKAQLGCVYCREADPICLDCHPRDPSKKMEIVRLVKTKPDLEFIKDELRKYMVICANCLRKHHQRLRNNATDEIELAEETDLSKTKKVKPSAADRPSGFSEVLEELRRKCFPDPKEPTDAAETADAARAATDLDTPAEADGDPIFGSVATTDS